jgi:hypothetical protein
MYRGTTEVERVRTLCAPSVARAEVAKESQSRVEEEKEERTNSRVRAEEALVASKGSVTADWNIKEDIGEKAWKRRRTRIEQRFSLSSC